MTAVCRIAMQFDPLGLVGMAYAVFMWLYANDMERRSRGQR